LRGRLAVEKASDARIATWCSRLAGIRCAQEKTHRRQFSPLSPSSTTIQNTGETSTMRLVRYTYPDSRTLAPVSSFRSPWAGLETELDRLFDSALADFSAGPASNRFPVDLYEDKDNTYLRAELPGVNREDINVEIVNGYLSITAARKASGTDGEESFSFSRSISVPDDVQADKVAAAYENGVLTVTLPKREEAKPKKVSVAIK
jgi:HSP20 family protein